jgi:hypothetical protein
MWQLLRQERAFMSRVVNGPVKPVQTYKTYKMP